MNNIDKENIKLDRYSKLSFLEFSDDFDEKYFYILEANAKYMKKWREEGCPNIFKIEINKLVEYLGGKDNIVSYDVQKSRFIVNLKTTDTVNKEGIQKMGAQGIVEVENQLKIIFGEDAKQLKKCIDDLM